MGRQSRADVVEKLKELGIEHDESMSYPELVALLKTSTGEASEDENGDENGDEGEGEGEEETPHVITQEDLDNNPQLIVEGVKVGDTVFLPPADDSSEPQNEPTEDENITASEVIPEKAVKAPKGKKTSGEVKYNLEHNNQRYMKGQLVTRDDINFDEMLSLGHIQ